GLPQPHLQVCLDLVSLDCPIGLFFELIKYGFTTRLINVAKFCFYLFQILSEYLLLMYSLYSWMDLKNASTSNSTSPFIFLDMRMGINRSYKKSRLWIFVSQTLKKLTLNQKP
ncbi:MAG: hypothetical protein ACM3JQ_05905, partial [Candidatus Eiseniibacteriota bacterium]